jgi:hypothetical protein
MDGGAGRQFAVHAPQSALMCRSNLGAVLRGSANLPHALVASTERTIMTIRRQFRAPESTGTVRVGAHRVGA